MQFYSKSNYLWIATAFIMVFTISCMGFGDLCYSQTVEDLFTFTDEIELLPDIYVYGVWGQVFT